MRLKLPRLTVQVKYLTLIAAVILGTSLVLSAYYYYAARSKTIAELTAKGSTLTINLALNGEEGVLFSDTHHLNLLITLLRDDPDVVGAEIKTLDGNRLVSNSEDMRFLNPEEGGFAQVADESLNDDTRVQMRQFRVRANNVLLLEFTAPITTQHIARDREEVGLMFDNEAGAEQEGQQVRIGSARIILSTARSFGEFQKIQRNIIVIASIVALAGILVTVPLVRITIRPIRQLAEGTKKIAGGDLSQRVVATSRDEIGELAESFNQMAVDLEKYHEELMQHSRTLEERVRERTRELKESNEGLELANIELRKAQAQLIQAGKMAAMGEFGAGVAHELNQPLAGIKGYTQLLLSMVDDDSPLRSRLVQIDKQASRMKEITQTMWNLARQSNFEYAFIDITQPVKDSLILMSEQFRQHQIDILLDIEDNLPRVYGDANQLHQVFLNFLTNAKDAFDEKGTGIVKFSVAPIADERYVEILVMDNGKGISPSIISEIFNPFFTTKPPGKGTGLGLSINFSIMEQHHGFMDVYSEESVGTAFSMVLPTEKFAACSKDAKETDGHPAAPCWVSGPDAPGGMPLRKPGCNSCETFVRYQASPESSLEEKFKAFIAACSSASSEN